MSKYTVKQPGPDVWDVHVDGLAPILDLTEAEAHIIAWSLNAVAEGGTLESVIPTEERISGGNADGARVFECRKYDGPSEGVRP